MAAPMQRRHSRRLFTAEDVAYQLLNDDDGDIPSGSDDDRRGSGAEISEEELDLCDDDMDPDYVVNNSDDEEDGDEAADKDSEGLDEHANLEANANVESDEITADVEPPAKKKNKSKKKERKVWQWKEEDLEDPGQLPQNVLTPTPEVANLKNEIDYFLILFGTDTIQTLVLETNRFRLVEKKDKISPVTEREMRQLLGIVIYMSVVHLPGRRDYWASATGQAFVADIMPVNRFEEILSLLHAADNALMKEKGEPGYDRLHKIRPLLDNLNENFAKCAEPEAHMSVDEQIVPFKGHHNLKVYMEKKTNKWGYKIWGSAGASGYMHKFYIQGDNLVQGEPNLPEGIGKSGEVVLNLVRHLPARTHIYFDNYFASPDLLLELKKRGLHATCTVRQNRRRLCPTLTKKQFEEKGRGSYDYRSAEGVLVCSWYDNKVVNVASNKCSVKPTTEVRRYDNKTKTYVNIECPALIKAYNKCMGGVDKCDMMLSLYRIKMKSRKWYRRLIFHMVDLALSNAWHLQNAVTGNSHPYYLFKIAIAECLVKSAVEPQPMRRDQMPDIPQDSPSATYVPKHVRFDGVNHLPRQMAKIPKCCKFPDCTRRTRYFCVKCKVYLCIDGKTDCFYNYHLTD